MKNMGKTKISERTIEFIKHVLPMESLSSILPIDDESVFDLIDLLESGVEVPLTQREEAGEDIDRSAQENAVKAIDELNEDPDNIDFDDLNERLAER